MAIRFRKGKGRHRRGFALLMVLLLVMVLAIVVFILQREVAREVAVGTNVRDDLVASFLSQLALVRGGGVLKLDDKPDYDSLNEDWAKPITWPGEKFGRGDGDAPAEGESQFKEPRILITDEERKFNLLLLVRGTKEQRDKCIEIFKRLVNICRRDDDRLNVPDGIQGDAKTVRRANDDTANTDTLVRNLLKYLEERASEDSDDLEFTAPGKKPDVRGMKKQTPYQMLTLGELLQVEGWTPQLLYGAPRVAPGEDPEQQDNRSFMELTDEEQFERTREQIDELDTRSRDPEPLPLIHYLTLYSSGRININTCSRELLLAMDEKLTWDVVEQILTAREQDRRDVLEAEENGGVLPEEDLGTAATEEEDLASFRPQDIASYQAFVARATNEGSAEGGGGTGGTGITLEGFTEEIYTAIRPLLSVRSTVFRVESSATVGKITNTIYALYRRTGTQAAPNNANNNANVNTTPNTTEMGASTTGDLPLPKEPTARLTLLFKDVKQD